MVEGADGDEKKVIWNVRGVVMWKWQQVSGSTQAPCGM